MRHAYLAHAIPERNYRKTFIITNDPPFRGRDKLNSSTYRPHTYTFRILLPLAKQIVVKDLTVWYECLRYQNKAEQMKNTVRQNKKNSKTMLMKAVALLAFIVAAIWSFHALPANYYFTPEALGRILETTDPTWAPVLFILTSFGRTIADVWATNSWDALISFKVCFSSALFILSCSIPLIIRKIRSKSWVKSI